MDKIMIDRECFNELVDLLTPFMDTIENRQGLLRDAWYGSNLLNNIQWEGSSRTFTSLAVNKAIDYGDTGNGLTALQALLDIAKGRRGSEFAKQVDALVKRCFATNPKDDEYIFLSYSSQDRASFVESLARDLSRYGYRIWIDNLGPKYTGITAGNEWEKEIATAIVTCELMIFVMTPDSIRSIWCKKEIDLAAKIGKAVIPVVGRPLHDEDNDLISNIYVGARKLDKLQYRDFTRQGYDRGLEVLLDDIEKQLPHKQ